MHNEVYSLLSRVDIGCLEKFAAVGVKNRSKIFIFLDAEQSYN